MLKRLTALIVTLGAFAFVSAEPLTASFTYQGELRVSGAPANGIYDLEFELYDNVDTGAQVGTSVVVDNVTVTGGVFSVELDFGAGPFAGDQLWLEVGVRDGASAGGYTGLLPRQKLTAAPYALHAEMVAANAIAGPEIANNTITAADIAGNAVAASELANDAVDTAAVQDGAITAAKLAANSVGSSEVTNNSLTAADLAANSVGTSEVADDSLTAADLAAEPGVVQALDFAQGSLLVASASTLESVELSAPAPGYAMVTATFDVRVAHTSGDFSSFARFNIEETEGNVVVGTAQVTQIPGAAASGNYWQTITIHKTFAIDTAGTQRYHLLGQQGNSVGIFTYDQVYLSAVFLPTAYGSISQ